MFKLSKSIGRMKIKVGKAHGSVNGKNNATTTTTTMLLPLDDDAEFLCSKKAGNYTETR